MRSIVNRLFSYPLSLSSLASYVATCLLYRGAPTTPSLLSWPYPLLLPLKPLFEWLGPLEILAVDAFGAAGVTLLARYLEHRLADRAGSSALMNFGAGLISWPLFIAFLNGLFYLTGAGIYRLPAG